MDWVLHPKEAIETNPYQVYDIQQQKSIQTVKKEKFPLNFARQLCAAHKHKQFNENN